jgi:hypothetical protein
VSEVNGLASETLRPESEKREAVDVHGVPVDPDEQTRMVAELAGRPVSNNATLS